MLLRGALLCTDAHLEESGASQGAATWRIVGDPTEGALVVLAAKAGLAEDGSGTAVPARGRDALRFRAQADDHRTRRSQQPMRESFGVQPGAFVAYVKGAPDVMLDLCRPTWWTGRSGRLRPRARQEIAAANAAMATSALRVLGVAYRPFSQSARRGHRRGRRDGLTFVGLMGMIDQARPEVKSAVALARRAGSRPSWSPVTTATPPWPLPERSAC